jgi:hypothetical protein
MIYSYFSKLKAALNATPIVEGYKVKKEIVGSFVGQMNENGLIRRWDNAPHHRVIETFPFHIHTKSEILPSKEVRLEDILKIIERIRLP